jgi:hypothetical protein
MNINPMESREAIPFPAQESVLTSEERFIRTEQEALSHLFGDDEQAASIWLTQDKGRNGAVLREATNRHLRISNNDPDAVIAGRIADELRALTGEGYREAA